MPEEIEAKLRVDSLEEVEQRLRACRALFGQETVQTDVYFDTPEGSLTRSDECLRLRCEKSGGHERLIVTYKGPKRHDDYKKRTEIELEVNGAGAAESLLAALGYRKALAFNKRRRVWRLGGCEVALDELPLVGVFVEIEGPDSPAILHVQETLGLSHVPHIMDSYASLIDQELSRLGRQGREVYLEEKGSRQ